MVKSIILRDEEYDLVMRARDELIHKGLDSLNPELQKSIKSQEGWDRLTRGAVISMGASLLFQELSNGNGKNGKKSTEQRV